ncbi:ubiquinol-cytochrome C chaperone family protein [Streptomyces gobiensis]|uniref:ubiquinol-cytochrome C chaperone family protein n=1 Tax=Streptomyces gobiensis TaxID=2875706 RepID=UPI001E56F6A1|nr:ubiquinol-cytochrome C chaperone family protein [Streptomyces gobiensis]UGY93911.1 ubiquinol-cytochrome C chaperone family protein [Streptomyces gobiensis]
MSDFTVSLAELRKLKKKLEESESQLEEALRRMEATGPKNLGKRSLDKACEDFEDSWEHGLSETKKRIKTLNEALPAIIKAYEKTEEEIKSGMDKSGG